jgi:hypothetical protein
MGFAPPLNGSIVGLTGSDLLAGDLLTDRVDRGWPPRQASAVEEQRYTSGFKGSHE